MRLNPFRKVPSRRRSSNPEGWLKPQTKRALAGVVLIVLAIIVALSFVQQAGVLGASVLSGLRRVFGWLAYATPVLAGYGGFRLVWPGREPITRTWLVGGALLLVGVLGILHLIGVSPSDALQVATEGKGGGYLGFLLSYPLSLASSWTLALVVFSALTLMGVFMTFNVSPTEIALWLRSFLPGRAGAEDEDGEAYETQDAAVTPVPRFRISSMVARRLHDPQQLPLAEQAGSGGEQQEQRALRRKQVRAANRRYNPPPLELLESSTRQPEGGDVEGHKQMIADTLRQFGIEVEMRKARVGPTVTQYTLRPNEGIRLSQITALQNDLARALKAHPVRIEAPIPNTDLVGIEIPNREVALVRLRDLLTAKEVRQADSPLTVALGRDVAGTAVAVDLDRMPHLLIAGATNSGKSVAIHSLLMSLLYHNSPALLRLVLVDPKRVELTAYNGIPHLWGEPVIVDTGKTLNALKWALREMDRRYKLLEEGGARNILSFNINNPDNAQPFIVIIIDELADLMAKHAREVEGPIVRLSQLARAVGIHLVLATQRPSVNVITGLIKANVPARIAFKVASQIDSRTILDMAGAEKLVGTGDMLYLASDNANPRRLQGGFVSEDEVRRVVQYIVEHNETEEYVQDEGITNLEVSDSHGGSEMGDDPLFEEAKRLALETRKLSASLLQRRLRVGYARAARLLDILEEQGVIGHAEGNKPREVLLEREREEFAPALSDEDRQGSDADSDSESREPPW
jgi:S-DNA-T family DNA segregation ATPase FtsK/SpoIIIE